jgi:tRNA (guanine-N7-)-methyltransferase
LRNLRVLRVETSYAVKYLLPPNSAAVVHLLFPDPWPKKRHHRRRVVDDKFLAALHRLLAPNGRFRIATDQEEYFQSIRQLLSPAFFIEIEAQSDENLPLTRFEKQFLEQAAPIYRLELRKVS